MNIFVPDEYNDQFKAELERFDHCVAYFCQKGIKFWVTNPEFPREMKDNLATLLNIPVILHEDINPSQF